MGRGRRGSADEDDEEYVLGDEYEEFGGNGDGYGGRKRVSRSNKQQLETETSSLAFTSQSEALASKRDNSNLRLKKDHSMRPIWVTKDHLILLEAFSPLYLQSYDFLVAIAEPEARPEHIHRYRLTQNSLYAAVAIAIDTETIIKVLETLCKTDLPIETIQFIRDSTRTFGKAKLVLKDNQHYVESLYPEVLMELLKHEAIKEARVQNETETLFEEAVAPVEDANNMGYRSIIDLDEENEASSSSYDGQRSSSLLPQRRTVSFRIQQDRVQIVKKHALDGYAPYIAKYPLIEEYDFRKDTFNASLSIDLRPSTRIRPYQEKSLGKMFG